MFIYKVTHKVSGKVYIGQTTGTIVNRWRDHCKGYKQPAGHLHRAIVKYGAEQFIVEEIATATSLEQLNALEEKYIAEFDCLSPKGYNILRGGNNRRHHEETKEKLHDALKGRHIQNRWNKGFLGAHSEETKAKISAKLKGRPIKNRMNGAPKGRPVSMERRKMISEALKGKPQPNKYRPVKVVQTGEIFESAAKASVVVGIERSNLLHYLKSGAIHKKTGLSFIYVDKTEVQK